MKSPKANDFHADRPVPNEGREPEQQCNKQRSIAYTSASTALNQNGKSKGKGKPTNAAPKWQIELSFPADLKIRETTFPQQHGRLPQNMNKMVNGNLRKWTSLVYHDKAKAVHRKHREERADRIIMALQVGCLTSNFAAVAAVFATAIPKLNVGSDRHRYQVINAMWQKWTQLNRVFHH